MLDYLHQGLKHWQTAISSGIGFIGVITTLFVNSSLSRRAEENRRLHEREVIRQVFLIEMSSIKIQAQECIDGVETPADGEPFFLVKPIKESMIYTSNQAAVKLLGPEQISSVLRVLLHLQMVRDRLLLVGKRKNIVDDVTEDWIEIKGKTSTDIFLKNMQDILENASDAVNKLDEFYR